MTAFIVTRALAQAMALAQLPRAASGALLAGLFVCAALLVLDNLVRLLLG
jgi:hypothetical protein